MRWIRGANRAPSRRCGLGSKRISLRNLSPGSIISAISFIRRCSIPRICLSRTAERSWKSWGGKAVGDEIDDGYVRVLAATGVTGYPYVTADASAPAGTEEAPIGLRGPDAPHPFYIQDASLRFDMVVFLLSLDTDPH